VEDTLLVRGGTIVTMNPARHVARGDVLVRDGEIVAVGAVPPGEKVARTIDAGGKLVLPGFVQAHVHLCQTLFRGAADGLPLLDWLRKRIWPLEAAHDVATMRASARLGLYDLIDTGVTTVLDMGTAHLYEVVFEEMERTAIRAIGGKAMMDHDPGKALPARLRESTKAALEESLRLAERWHGAGRGRVRYALAPRFPLSSTPDLHRESARLALERGFLIHTHAGESLAEVEETKKRHGGARPVSLLASHGLLRARNALAHAVHLDDAEVESLAENPSGVAHCPGSNLKLGSGIADVPRLRKARIPVAIGSDGAACNNRLDLFHDLRLAAVLPEVSRGPGALSPWEALEMATVEGARVLGLESATGSVETGKRADLLVLDLRAPWTVPGPDLASAVVYGADARNVETVICDGVLLKEKGKVLPIDREEVVARGLEAWRAISSRAKLG
jgi:cytosine/adenosine deaminase-related metal-dependent hydrolase